MYTYKNYYPTVGYWNYGEEPYVEVEPGHWKRNEWFDFKPLIITARMDKNVDVYLNT